MAPRTAKAKKTTDLSEAPKKGRGKAKNVEESENDVMEAEAIIEKAPQTEKKAKRGKKAIEENGIDQNGKAEDVAPPAKRGRKKNVEEVIAEEKDESTGDQSADDEASAATEQDEDFETNGHLEDTENSSGKGRKKPTKKVTAKKENSASKPVRGRKAKQDNVETESQIEIEEKPKGKSRGRKAAPKIETELELEEKGEEEKTEAPVSKGRKKGKAAKEKSPESEKGDSLDDKIVEEKKKETKGRKKQGKKGQAKEEVEDIEDEAKEDEPASKKRKVNKKEEKGKGESKDEDADEEMPEAKPAKGRRGQKKVVEFAADVAEDDSQDSGDTGTKRRRKAPEEKAPSDDSKKKAPLKNKAVTNYEDIDFSNSSKSSQGKEWNFKIASWNVDGIRAWLGKGGMDYVKYEKPDILCLQEIKCAQDKMPEEIKNIPGYHAYWLCSDKDGYAGVGIYTTKLAMNVQYGLHNEELDTEGRIITAEYEQFYLICTYVPNAGRKLVTLPKRLQWNEEFRKHVQELDKKKPVIICGDMNVSHKEIDLANPKTNKKNAGFTEEERAGMTDLLGDGFVDTFRHINPDKTGAYTFWTYMMNSRAKNVGWRLDYIIVSERLLPSLCDNVIRDQVYGSDHCPISLFLHLTSADKPKE